MMETRDLIPGASKREGGKYFNHHFVSSTVQAWPHSDIYDKDKMCIEFEELSARAAKQYEVDYGSTKNAQISHQYGRATGVPRKITGIEQRNGHATAIIPVCSRIPTRTAETCVGFWQSILPKGSSGAGIRT